MGAELLAIVFAAISILYALGGRAVDSSCRCVSFLVVTICALGNTKIITRYQKSHAGRVAQNGPH